jgi:hypothetical protein
VDPKLGTTLGYIGTALLRAFEIADFEQRLERLEQSNANESTPQEAGTAKKTIIRNCAKTVSASRPRDHRYWN